MTTVVIGGGLAAATAAVELCPHMPVTWVDTAKPNGKHHGHGALSLHLGAQTPLVKLMRTVGLDPNVAFHRFAFALEVWSDRHRRFRLKAATLPSPFHLFLAFLRHRQLSWPERLKSLRMLSKLAVGDKLPADITVAQLMEQWEQPSMLIQWLWDPWCRMNLLAPASEAPAKAFAQLLKQSWLGKKTNSDWLIPALDLNVHIMDKARQFLRRHQGRIIDGRDVRIEPATDHPWQVIVAHEGCWPAYQVVLADHTVNLRGTCLSHPVFRDWRADLDTLSYQSYIQVQLAYPEPVALHAPFLGLLVNEETVNFWVHDERLRHRPGLLTAVCHGHSPLDQWSDDRIIHTLDHRIRSCFPGWPAPKDISIVRENQYSLSSENGGKTRPWPHQSKWPGLWFAGELTATASSAMLSKEVADAQECARQLLTTENGAGHDR